MSARRWKKTIEMKVKSFILIFFQQESRPTDSSISILCSSILNDWMAAWISYRVIVSCKHKTVLNWYCRAICRREMERGSWVNRRNLFSVVWWSFPPPPDSISSSITTAWKMLAIFLFFSMPATTAHNTRMLCNGLGGGERKRERERECGANIEKKCKHFSSYQSLVWSHDPNRWCVVSSNISIVILSLLRCR